MQETEPIDNPSWWIAEQAPRLVLFARQWVSGHADAEDVFHTAFVRYWRNRESVREPVPYLYACVRSIALNWRRAQARRQKHEQSAPQPLFATEHDTVELSESAGEVADALGRLRSEQREVVVMRIWGELSFPQIGDVLSISPSTADSRYRAGLKALQRELKGQVCQ